MDADVVKRPVISGDRSFASYLCGWKMNIAKTLGANVLVRTPSLNDVAPAKKGSSRTVNPTGEERDSSEIRRDPSLPSGWDCEARFK